MTCENCIAENEFDLDIHIIENGPFDTQAECENSANNPVAFFSIDIDTPSILSEGQDLVVTDLVIKLTDQNLIDSAIRQISGLEPKKYIRGDIIDEPVWYNQEYLYHVDPSSISFVEIQVLGNNQQNLDFYRLQADRKKLPSNVKVKGRVSPKQPKGCKGCSNTFYPWSYSWYCSCSPGTEAQECLTEDCGVYMPDPNDSKKVIWKEKHICVSPKPYPDYVWNNTLCQWVCPGDGSNKTVDEVKTECENRSIFGLAQSWYTFKPETCDCVAPTTCEPCKTDNLINPLRYRPLKTNGQSGYIYVNENDKCTACKCRENDNFGTSLCGPKGKIANTQTCECECDEETACPGDLKELIAVNTWTPSVAGADLYPPCSCKCKEPCALPLVQNDDTCECNCPTIAGQGEVEKCIKDGQTLCVQCSSDNIWSRDTCTCECGDRPCPQMKVVTRVSGGTSLGVERNPICTCRCPENDTQCLCGYSSTFGGPDGLSDVFTECPEDKEYRIRQDNGQCECVCKNPKTNAECGPRKVWNEQNCKCECADSHVSCLFGREFNEDTCDCDCPTAIFNGNFVSGTYDSASLECLYEVTCYRCEECPTGRTRQLTKETIAGKSCEDFEYGDGKKYVSNCDDCEILDIVTDAELTDANTITATVSKIIKRTNENSLRPDYNHWEIEIELQKSNEEECCSEAIFVKKAKTLFSGYSLESISTTQIPTNPQPCT